MCVDNKLCRSRPVVLSTRRAGSSLPSEPRLSDSGWQLACGAGVIRRSPPQSVIARTVGGDELFSVDVAAVAPPSLTCADGTPAFYTVMRSDLQRVLERRLPEGAHTSGRV